MDRSDFEKLFRNHFTPLTNIAYSFVRDRDTACDIVQHVFIKLWENLNKTNITSSEKSYLHRAVINTALNYIEKNKRIRLHDDFTGFENKIISEQYDANKDEKDKALNKQLFAAMDELPPRCKAVFMLSRIDGMKNREISENLGISQKAVEKHIGKALKYLRVKLNHLTYFIVWLICFSISGRVL